MDFVVEDGTGLSDATSYITGAFVIEFAVATGAAIGAGNPEAAATAGSLWLDARYGSRYPGTRKEGRDQGLGWPRIDAFDASGEKIPDDAVPVEIMRAAAAAALREMAAPGSLAPDTAAGPALKSERKKLGPMETDKTYAIADGGVATSPSFPEIDGYLAGLLGPGAGATVRLLRV